MGGQTDRKHVAVHLLPADAAELEKLAVALKVTVSALAGSILGRALREMRHEQETRNG